MASMMTYLSSYFLVVLLSVTNCQSQMPIITLTANATNSSGRVGIYEGDSHMLTCQIENLNGKVVGWIFKEQITSTTNPAKYQVTTNGAVSTLTILNLTRVQDAGVYSCSVYQSDELPQPLVRKSLEILVYYFPDDMYPICHGPVIITEGEPVTFRCESEPGERPVVLTWSRDSGTIQDTMRYGMENGKKFAEYTFVPRKDDIGMTAYCTISSDAIFRGKTSNCSVGPLSVQYPPTNISLTNQNVAYSNSTYDSILCTASAFPTDISYTWSFNTNLDSSQQILINGNQTLVILNVTLCEFPIIATCQAANDIGNITANYTLCEPPLPQNPVCYPENQVVLTEGVPEMFHCVSYSDKDNPADVVWSRDEGLISADSITTGELTNNYKYSNYTFVPTRDDFGINVICSLRSGTRFPDYCIIGPFIIQYIPSDAAISNGTYSYENMTYKAFSCKSSAFPSNVSYSWSFNTPLSSSQFILTNNNQTVVILNITTCKTLIIATCHASNDIGKYSVDVTLCDLPPPPPSPTQLARTTLTSEQITSNGLTSTGLPITTSDQDATTPQTLHLTSEPLSTTPEPVPLTPEPLPITLETLLLTPEPLPPTPAFSVFVLASLIILVVLLIIIGVFCYIARTSCHQSGHMDMNKTDEENVKVPVELTGDSRIRNDATTRGSSSYTTEDIPMDSAVDNPVFDEDEWGICPLEEVADESK